MACPACGATEGLKQVEADTFYCSHHRGLFKWTAADRLRVDTSSYFCACGNRIKFQCHLCKNGLCEDCDVVEAQARLIGDPDNHRQNKERADLFGRLVLPVQGFGYLEITHQTQMWTIARDRIEPVPVPDGVIGPFLGVADIWPQLPADPDSLRHVCCSCVAGKVPETAEAIASGKICADPGCGAASAKRCSCCGDAFCAQHFERQLNKEVLYYAAWKQYRQPNRAGLCDMCGDESELIVREKIDDLFKNPLADLPGSQRRVAKLIDRHDATPRPCSKNRIFDTEMTKKSRAYGSHSSRSFEISTYKIVDERDKVNPRPA
jgi:hypothetical protein